MTHEQAERLITAVEALMEGVKELSANVEYGAGHFEKFDFDMLIKALAYRGH